jgi:hypothetical protein
VTRILIRSGRKHPQAEWLSGTGRTLNSPASSVFSRKSARAARDSATATLQAREVRQGTYLDSQELSAVSSQPRTGAAAELVELRIDFWSHRGRILTAQIRSSR